MSFKFILLYSFTVFIASIIPGPSMLLALNHGLKYGLKYTLFTALGNVTATLIQAILSILGLSFVLLQSEIIFYIIKYVGAAYLIFIGIKMFFSKNNYIDIDKNNSKKTHKFHSLFLESFALTIGNPKAIIFFTALFPQFINLKNNTIFQYFVILILLLVIAFLSMMIYGFLGDKITNLFNNLKIRKTFNRIIGGTFVGLGIGLAVSKTK
jgi:threonine/homoserine/homoserine lactone efflux protein